MRSNACSAKLTAPNDAPDAPRVKDNSLRKEGMRPQCPGELCMLLPLSQCAPHARGSGSLPFAGPGQAAKGWCRLLSAKRCARALT